MTLHAADILLWLQWCLVAALAVWLWVSLKSSPSRPLLLGALALWTLRGLFSLAHLTLLASMMDVLFPVASMVVVVIFQPELRAYLSTLGRRIEWLGRLVPWLHDRSADEHPQSIAVICDALEILGENRVGALVVLPRRDPVEPLLQGGVEIDARISRELILSLFVTDKTSGIPDLHDGAAVVVGDRCRFAGAVLPLTERPTRRRIGTRHRAALGITEHSDAIAIVVSESGRISVACEGNLYPLPPRERLVDHLSRIASGAYPEPGRRTGQRRGREDQRESTGAAPPASGGSPGSRKNDPGNGTA